MRGTDQTVRSGKSTLMRMFHGNYLAASGSPVVAGLDIMTAQRC